MRSRISWLLLSAIVAVSLTACSKKEQTQNAPPATNDTATSAQAAPSATTSAPATPPPQQMAPATQAPVAQAPATPPAAPPPQPEMAQATEPPPPPPPLVVPAGASLVVRVGNTISSKTANPGDTFTGTLAHAATVHSQVAIPAGATVTGTVVDAKSPGKFKGEGVLSISLTSISVRGVPTHIATSAYTVTVKGKGKRTAVMAGGGTGAGALIGGLAGGGKGALIGGLVGAGAGTAGAAFTGNKELEIPAETAVTFRLSHSITVRRSGGSSRGSADQSQPDATQ